MTPVVKTGVRVDRSVLARGTRTPDELLEDEAKDNRPADRYSDGRCSAETAGAADRPHGKSGDGSVYRDGPDAAGGAEGLSRPRRSPGSEGRTHPVIDRPLLIDVESCDQGSEERDAGRSRTGEHQRVLPGRCVRVCRPEALGPR